MRALRQHEIVAHQRRPWTAEWIADTVCPSCSKQFWTTWRLRRHVERSLGCALAVRLDGCKPTEEELMQARRAEADERAAAKKGGPSPDCAVLPAMDLSDALCATMRARP